MQIHIASMLNMHNSWYMHLDNALQHHDMIAGMDVKINAKICKCTYRNSCYVLAQYYIFYCTTLFYNGPLGGLLMAD